MKARIRYLDIEQFKRLHSKRTSLSFDFRWVDACKISNCPAGHHRPWAWDVGMSGYLVVWLGGWLAAKSTKIDVENS